MNCRSVTEPSRCTKKDTSASSGVLCAGRCQRRSTCETMFCRYSGNGNAMPSVLTVATSLPVDGFSPGKDRKSTRLNSSHGYISYAVFCLKKKKKHIEDRKQKCDSE